MHSNKYLNCKPRGESKTRHSFLLVGKVKFEWIKWNNEWLWGNIMASDTKSLFFSHRRNFKEKKWFFHFFLLLLRFLKAVFLWWLLYYVLLVDIILFICDKNNGQPCVTWASYIKGYLSLKFQKYKLSNINFHKSVMLRYFA